MQGLEGTPQFKRNRIANQAEQIEMVMAEANYLDDQTVLELLPNITPDMIETILARRDANTMANLSSMEALQTAMDEPEDETEE